MLFQVLDVRLLKNAIVGVTATQEWRQALDLLPRHKKIAPLCSVVYSAIITAAFRTGDHDLAWQLFDIMRQEGQVKGAVILPSPCFLIFPLLLFTSFPILLEY